MTVKHRECKYQIIFGQLTFRARVFYYTYELFELESLLTVGKLQHRGRARASYLLRLLQQIIGGASSLVSTLSRLLFYFYVHAGAVIISFGGLSYFVIGFSVTL